jgi:DNA-binding transcriptional LysR family regulator
MSGDMPWSDRIGSRLKLRDLHIFMVVASAGTMGRAATELAVSQPVISKAIADLEHAVGARLFDRSRRGVELTDYGRSLRDSGIAVFDDLRQGVKRLEALADPNAGEVRLGTTEPLATGFVSAALKKMAARYPRMNFHLVQGDLTTLRTRDLRARNIEFAVGRILEPFGQDEFAVEALFSDPFAIVVGRNSKWAKQRRIGLADLVHERWVLPPLPIILGTIHGAFEAAGLQPPRADVLTLSIHVHNNLLATGKFVTALPRSTFGWGTDHLAFKVLPIEMPTTFGPVAIVTLRGRTLSPPAQRFTECLRELAPREQSNGR